MFRLTLYWNPTWIVDPILIAFYLFVHNIEFQICPPFIFKADSDLQHALGNVNLLDKSFIIVTAQQQPQPQQQNNHNCNWIETK